MLGRVAPVYKPLMVASTNRVTPSTHRLRRNMSRSRRQLKQKRKEESPSWVEALKRRYAEENSRAKGMPVDSRSWAAQQKDAKRARELVQQRGRGKKPALDDSRDVAAHDGAEVQGEIDPEREARLNKRQPLELQVFLKGLPLDTEESDLDAHLSRFGKLRKIYLVKSSVTGGFSGTAFVHFMKAEGSKSLLDHAEENARETASAARAERSEATSGLSRHKAKELLHKLKHQQVVSREPFILFRNTRVTVLKPMSRTDAEEFVGAMHKGGKKTNRTPTGADDPRNLYLLLEGHIHPDTPAAKGLPPRTLEALQRDYEERKSQLRNVNYFVSKVRLSVRNLPREVDDKQLRDIVLQHAREFFKRNPDSKDKAQWGKYGPIKQCRIMKDNVGQSRRFGFVELCSHELALYCLRMINNNPELFGPQQRPIVNFAIEDANALLRRQQHQEARKRHMEQEAHEIAQTTANKEAVTASVTRISRGGRAKPIIAAQRRGSKKKTTARKNGGAKRGKAPPKAKRRRRD